MPLGQDSKPVPPKYEMAVLIISGPAVIAQEIQNFHNVKRDRDDKSRIYRYVDIDISLPHGKYEVQRET